MRRNHRRDVEFTFYAMHAGGIPNDPPPSPIPGDERPHTYEIGTLRYNKGSLFKLFLLLLGGDFALVFFEGIFGPFGTLYTKQFHAPDSLIGVINGSVPGLVNILFLPSISRWSDSWRGPWGRRVPFLAASVPMVFASIVLMGFAPEIGGVLYHRLVHPFAPSFSSDAVTLTVLTLLTVVFHFGNMILINAYTWLQRDTIPLKLMARFISWFRFVSTASGALFSWYVFPYVIDDRKVVCISIGLFYVVVFAIMCRFVKEGDYPPPIAERGNAAQLYISFFRQCFILPIYRWAFIQRMLAGMTVCGYGYMIFFQTKTLGVSLVDLGKLGAVTGILSLVLLVPLGWLCDKLSPFRVQFFCTALGLAFTALNFFFNVNEYTLIFFTLITLPLSAAGGLAGTAVSMELFPSQKFGQFSAAANVLGTGIKIVGMPAAGLFLGYMQSNYRMVYAWALLWDGLGFVMLYLFYREWQRLGGAENYVPPIPPD